MAATARDHGRRARLARTLGPVPAPSEDTVVLVAALRRLPVQQRRALAMHYLLDLSIADIAAEAGVPEGTLKSWLRSQHLHEANRVTGFFR